jgi:branched-chain amino acid transport system permease protein
MGGENLIEFPLVAQTVLNGLMGASIYILIGLGLILLLSIANIMQLAHGEVYMLGAYTTYYLSVVLGLPYLLALILSVLIWGGLGILIEKAFFKPFRQREFFPSVVMAAGLMVLLNTTGMVAFGSSTKVVTTPFPGVMKIAGAVVSLERLIVIVISIVFVGALLLMLHRTKLGQAMIAVSQEMQGAALMGISADRVASTAMFIGCALAALAGGMMGAIFSLTPSMGGPVLMKGIAVMILGGFGSILGAVVGGIILGFVDSIVPILASVEMASMTGFILIILMLIFKPQGLMGRPSP